MHLSLTAEYFSKTIFKEWDQLLHSPATFRRKQEGRQEGSHHDLYGKKMHKPITVASLNSTGFNIALTRALRVLSYTPALPLIQVSDGQSALDSQIGVTLGRDARSSHFFEQFAENCLSLHYNTRRLRLDFHPWNREFVELLPLFLPCARWFLPQESAIRGKEFAWRIIPDRLLLIHSRLISKWPEIEIEGRRVRKALDFFLHYAPDEARPKGDEDSGKRALGAIALPLTNRNLREK